MLFDCKPRGPMYDKVDGGYGDLYDADSKAMKMRKREAAIAKRRELVKSIGSKCLRLFKMFR